MYRRAPRRCPQYPAHSHWALTGPDTIFIDWGNYGKYELKVDAANSSMEGSVQGKPAQWRKATLLQAITVDEKVDYEGH